MENSGRDYGVATGQVYEPCLFRIIKLQRLLIGMAYTPCYKTFFMKTKIEIVKVSTCCNSDVRYNGYVGLTDYGWTCNRCDRKCNTKEVEKKVVVRR